MLTGLPLHLLLIVFLLPFWRRRSQWTRLVCYTISAALIIAIGGPREVSSRLLGLPQPYSQPTDPVSWGCWIRSSNSRERRKEGRKKSQRKATREQRYWMHKQRIPRTQSARRTNSTYIPTNITSDCSITSASFDTFCFVLWSLLGGAIDWVLTSFTRQKPASHVGFEED
ncbi:hypothetical protein P168DRAFT_62086 [Aspergillus campestris IBT 28561]|uniref:Uncharacterized protein n=1 Tax=Aspergillus campestris (strain IBT 28561) TaxID=1392248 RepID=A0A2I1CUK5_ASPC2|nr:uncharacterized protein P168DRAFT_62086 [Aspergillus campestris IBT 28561]PKY01313.1 hypothetical protein P168DRAFT_62086 [Aspergillus campestris IBT 28561]